jgi:8-oxo-dGTP pyrophosphatase MutT (NUDIX family)
MLDIDPLREGVPPRAAATVILLRDRPLRDDKSALEVFLVRRTKSAAFMGGAYVFPGGKVDPTDSDPALITRLEEFTADAARLALAEDLEPEAALAFFIAAIRETFEESGVLFAKHATRFDLNRVRARLASGTSFSVLVNDLELSLEPQMLVPFARWVTPSVEQRRFDARFFVAAAPDDMAATHDETETITSCWKTPSEAIAEHAEKLIDLPPPTLRTLEELASFEHSSDVLALARSRRPPLVRPVFRDLGDGIWILALPGDPEHPEREARLPGPTRFTLRDGHFVSG